MARVTKRTRKKPTEIEARIEEVAQARYASQMGELSISWDELTDDQRDAMRADAKRWLAMYDAAQRFPIQRPER